MRVRAVSLLVAVDVVVLESLVLPVPLPSADVAVPVPVTSVRPVVTVSCVRDAASLAVDMDDRDFAVRVPDVGVRVVSVAVRSNVVVVFDTAPSAARVSHKGMPLARRIDQHRHKTRLEMQGKTDR